MVPEAAPIDLRRTRFSRAVTRLVTDARERGMTIEKIVEATGVSWTTIDRWVKGDWNKDPRGTQVKALSEGLGGSLADLYAALGWSEGPDRPEPEPTLDPRLRAINRILADPSVSLLEKIAIQSQLDYIAKRNLAPPKD